MEKYKGNYDDMIDNLYQTVVDIQSCVLLNKLLELGHEHNYILEPYGDDVVLNCKNMLMDFMEQHQSELKFDADKVCDMYSEFRNIKKEMTENKKQNKKKLER